jgi:hypothetical protein
MTIDSILTEWSYRLPSGYPTKSKDYELLYHVILEMTDCSPLVARNIVNKAQGLNEAEGEDNLLDFTQLNLPDDLRMQIENRYEKLSPAEQDEFNKNYRKHSIQSYMNTGYKPFTKFYDILPTGKSAGGMGKGEIQVLLAVADSQPGGTASHDIVMSNGQWEVKEVGKLPTLTKAGTLGKTPDSKTFRPAKAGMPIEGDLLTYTLTFFNDIVRPLANMGDSFEELKELVDQHSWKQLNDLTEVINKIFVPLMDNVSRTEISYKSGWAQMHKGWKLLHEILWKTDLDIDIHDTRLTIKTSNETMSYWISADDFKKIQSASADVNAVSINIGQQITNETGNAAIWFNKLKHNSLIKNPNMMIELLNTTKNKFFFGIIGLIAYDVNNPGIPIVTTAADWTIVGFSQGMWVFGLKSVYANYEFIQLQS